MLPKMQCYQMTKRELTNLIHYSKLSARLKWRQYRVLGLGLRFVLGLKLGMSGSTPHRYALYNIIDAVHWVYKSSRMIGSRKINNSEARLYL